MSIWYLIRYVHEPFDYLSDMFKSRTQIIHILDDDDDNDNDDLFRN